MDRERDLARPKFTFTECAIALAISVALVSLIAISLVEEIEPMVEKFGIPDNFMGLILVPLVEKAAEHLTAIDEAWDNQMVITKIAYLAFVLFTDQPPCRISLCSTASAPQFRQLFSTHPWSFLLAGAWTIT